MASIFDGVLADFNSDFISLVIQVTGEDKFPPRPFDIPCWSYPTHYGYTHAQESKCWDFITQGTSFWRGLSPYPDARMALSRLNAHVAAGDDVYFITSRPGKQAKAQTEHWLSTHGFDYLPTVLIASDKHHCCQALRLDAYVDDRWENCLSVAGSNELVDNTVQWVPSQTKTYMVERPWNRNTPVDDHNIIVVDSANDFMRRIG